MSSPRMKLNPGIVKCSELNDLESQNPLHDSDAKIALTKAISSYNLSEATKLITDLVNTYDKDRIMSFNLHKIGFIDFGNTMLLSFCEIITDTNDRLRLFSKLELLLSCQNTAECKQLLIEIAEYCCQIIQLQSDQSQNKIVNDIKAFVHEHFSDFNLSLSSISSSLGFTPSYLSRIFKEDTTIGLLEYINRVRVDHAKELLTNHSHTMDEVAALVGFTNVRTFSRVFSKYEDITPGKFSKQ